ncbi:hypothetical protein ABT168_17400 [Streptomyces sp. NPDC001793]|uniref:hypothetical protein n=1 Tax=Streptomyces sp. NPDC001793 TaxID=3154657 RepID=UPI0033201034
MWLPVAAGVGLVVALLVKWYMDANAEPVGGYFPTVQEAWSQFTAGPLPDQVDASQLSALQTKGSTMTSGRVVVDIPDTASHFTHHEEYVYLPPAWFTGTHHPPLRALIPVQ